MIGASAGIVLSPDHDTIFLTRIRPPSNHFESFDFLSIHLQNYSSSRCGGDDDEKEPEATFSKVFYAQRDLHKRSNTDDIMEVQYWKLDSSSLDMIREGSLTPFIKISKLISDLVKDQIYEINPHQCLPSSTFGIHLQCNNVEFSIQSRHFNLLFHRSSRITDDHYLNCYKLPVRKVLYNDDGTLKVVLGYYNPYTDRVSYHDVITRHDPPHVYAMVEKFCQCHKSSSEKYKLSHFNEDKKMINQDVKYFVTY